MDFETARQVILRQTIAPGENRTDSFIHRLRQGQPPVPGQVTSLLLALKVLYQGLQSEPALDRPLVQALFSLAYDSQQYYDAGQRAGTTWPPLLREDLKRIALGVQSVILNRWLEESGTP